MRTGLIIACKHQRPAIAKLDTRVEARRSIGKGCERVCKPRFSISYLRARFKHDS